MNLSSINDAGLPNTISASIDDNFVNNWTKYPAGPFLDNLPQNTPRKQYVSRRDHNNSSNYIWSPRKNALSLISFLSRVSDSSDGAIFIGACSKIAWIFSLLFPSIKPVILIDDGEEASFDSALPSDIILVHDKFSLDLASSLCRQHFSTDSSIMIVFDLIRSYLTDDLVIEAMREQMTCISEISTICRLRSCLLKLRLPWSDGSCKLPDGQVLIQPYSKSDSTELRLLVSDFSSEKLWDYRKYEEQCSYFNSQIRPMIYVHGVEGTGLDDSYDSALEVEIWRRYCSRTIDGFVSMSITDQNIEISHLAIRLTMELGPSKRCSSWLSTSKRHLKQLAKMWTIDSCNARLSSNDQDGYDYSRKNITSTSLKCLIEVENFVFNATCIPTHSEVTEARRMLQVEYIMCNDEIRCISQLLMSVQSFCDYGALFLFLVKIFKSPNTKRQTKIRRKCCDILQQMCNQFTEVYSNDQVNRAWASVCSEVI